MKIIRAIVEGVESPQALAEHRDPRCKASKDKIKKALTENYQTAHIFALKQTLAIYDAYQITIHTCDGDGDGDGDGEIKHVLAELAINKPEAKGSKI
jgi:hypothetical protein